jgi:hypothetical protein
MDDFFVCETSMHFTSSQNFKTHCINYMVDYKIVGPVTSETFWPIGQTEVKPSKLVPQISF